ncbi:hypothetical protein [Paenibacillus lactis]|uniref:Uncharacterized protein n=1 Tax=Paenibacillus lactis 154 TaxID=743719 RepID=G4HL75_9BACL|nr:hypothetical protein [Paenibacillus lactis]EHB57529.1 hypothetical protein PaelaDRAFT_4736 [Paenibacillus lactis 154]
MNDIQLLNQQDALQHEADEVVKELRLEELLATAGTPVRVGSSALGLMVWRDLDITVVCSKLQVDEIARIASRLMTSNGVRELRFLNDSGDFRTDASYPDGLYLGVKYTSSKGKDWAMDLWFVDEPDQQPDLKHVATMPARLTTELRHAILQIKSSWAARQEYGKEVKSYDIYTAVLEDDVRTPEQFEAWLRTKA